MTVPTSPPKRWENHIEKLRFMIKYRSHDDRCRVSYKLLFEPDAVREACANDVATRDPIKDAAYIAACHHHLENELRWYTENPYKGTAYDLWKDIADLFDWSELSHDRDDAHAFTVGVVKSWKNRIICDTVDDRDDAPLHTALWLFEDGTIEQLPTTPIRRIIRNRHFTGEGGGTYASYPPYVIACIQIKHHKITRVDGEKAGLHIDILEGI